MTVQHAQSLREAARAAWQREKAERAELERKRAEEQKQKLIQAAAPAFERMGLDLGELARDVEPGRRLVVEVDGITFAIQEDQWLTVVYVLLPCRECGSFMDKVLVWHSGTEDEWLTAGNPLPDVGRALEQMDRGEICNSCWRKQAASSSPPSVEERLLEAIREIVRQEVEACVYGG